MRYLCLIYDDENARLSWPQSDLEAMRRDYFAFIDDVKAKGQYVGGSALQPTHTATTVRVREGKVSTTDGPFAETREQLGGFFLIEANDLNEALQVAARIPGARWGSVEVRPILETPRPQS
jgi:hypothetical protein